MSMKITKWCYASVGDVVCYAKDYVPEHVELDVNKVEMYLILELERRGMHMQASLLQLDTGKYFHNFITRIDTIVKRLDLDAPQLRTSRGSP